MFPRAALGDSGLPPSTPASVLRKEGPGLTASEPGAVSDNTTSRRLVAAVGSRSSADLRQMLLAKKQRTQDLPSEGLSKNIPERSPDTPYSVCKSIEAVTTIEKPTTVTPCKGVPLARGAVPEDTSQSMLRLNKEPPKPLAVPKTSGQGPPEKLSAVGTFKSSAAGQPPCISFSDGVRLLGQEVQLCKNAGLDATAYSVLAGDVISESHACCWSGHPGSFRWHCSI